MSTDVMETETGVILRPYQEDAVNAAYEAWENGTRSVMWVMFTGAGKTVAFNEVARRWPEDQGRVVIIAHRKELIDQAANKYFEQDGEMPGIEMGMRRELDLGHGILDKSKVLVTSVQTLNAGKKCRTCHGTGECTINYGGEFERQKCNDCLNGRVLRMTKFDPLDCGLLVYDESHHAVSKTARRAIEHFRQNPNLKELYVTATPDRHDKIGMRTVVEECVANYDIHYGVDNGWLVPISQRYVVIEGLDFSQCRTTAGDLNNGDLAKVMGGGDVPSHGTLTESEREQLEEQERMLHEVAGPTIAEAQGRSTIVFCVSVAHAERLAEIFNRHPGVTADCVHGGTPAELRDQIIQDFREERIQILTNCSVLTEGFDAPNCKVIANAKPTKSRAVYVQAVGRGTRPLTGLIDEYDDVEDRKQAIANSAKPELLVLDFVGNSGKHKLISTLDVLAGDLPDEVYEDALEHGRQAGKEGRAVDMRTLVEESRQRLEQARIERARAEREAVRRREIKAQVQYYHEQVDPFHGAAVPERAAGTEFYGGASEKQIGWLVNRGISREKAMSFSKKQAGAVITKIKQDNIGGDFILAFGKYRGTGKKLKNVPKGYVNWMKQKISPGAFRDELMYHIRLMEQGR